MRPVPHSPLFLGHAGDLRDPRALFAAGTEAVVELADAEPGAELPRSLTRLRFPLADGADNPPHLVRLAVESVAALVRAGVPTLVSCSAGMSRSVVVAAAGLALAGRRDFAECLARVTASGPADVSPGFLAAVRRALAPHDFRPYAPSDADSVLRLNAESVAALSPLDAARLAELAALSDWFEVATDSAGGVAGFLLAFGETSAYGGSHFGWFQSRLRGFLYIDRVVLDAGARGAGLGRALYGRASDEAARRGLVWLACEVDVEPPNAGSLAFHAKLGFAEVGRWTPPGGAKRVALLARGAVSSPVRVAERGA